MNKWSEREKDKSLMCFQILGGKTWKGCGHPACRVFLSGASRHCLGMPVISQDTPAHLYLFPGPPTTLGTFCWVPVSPIASHSFLPSLFPKAQLFPSCHTDREPLRASGSRNPLPGVTTSDARQEHK